MDNILFFVRTFLFLRLSNPFLNKISLRIGGNVTILFSNLIDPYAMA
jgi:hypothetical protein